MEEPTRYTAYPEINAMLDDLSARLQALLGDQLVALYLHGSLAYGDFNPDTSDIDFLAVTVTPLSAEQVGALRVMHQQLAAQGYRWIVRLEGSYIPQDHLRHYNPALTIHPALRMDGSFDMDHHGQDWIIQRYLIRERAVPLFGIPASELIDPVLPDALRQAALATLYEWWRPQLTESFRLTTGEYQAYGVLTMCRILYTLQLGHVVSKPVAARWALENVDPRWHPLIEAALYWCPDGPEPGFQATLAFIQHVVDFSQTSSLQT